MSGAGKVERHVSAGGVVYREAAPGRVEVALCGRAAAATWSLPKGTPDPGERVEQTALREVQEETGLAVEIEQPLGHIEYWFQAPERGARCHKRVYFFLMRAVGGNVADHDAEFDAVEWFAPERAAAILTYPNEAEVLNRALAAVSAYDRAGA